MGPRRAAPMGQESVPSLRLPRSCALGAGVALARKDLALRHTRNITPHRDKRALLTNGAPIRCRRVPRLDGSPPSITA